MEATYQNKDHWYLFLLLPFLAVIMAIRSFRTSWAKNIIWAFVVFYGFTFSILLPVSKDGVSADINRNTDEITNLYQSNIGFSDIPKLYQDNTNIDILQLTISIAVSLVTDSPRVLTAVFGLVFGFFYSRNIWFVIERMNGKLKQTAIVLLIAYALINPIWNINGFRFFTAAQVFIYGLLPFLFDGKKKGILISALSILVHFSFLLPVGVLLLYVILGNRTLIYFIFFLASLLSTGINIVAFNNLVESSVPKVLADRTATYRNEDTVEELQSGTAYSDSPQRNWYMNLYNAGLQWPLTAFLAILFFKRKKMALFDKNFLSSLSFSFLFLGVANIMTSLPSGGRFITVAMFSALPLVILYVQNFPGEKYLTHKVMIALPALLLFIIVSIRIGFLTISVNTIMGNPIVALFTDYNIALDEIIK